MVSADQVVNVGCTEALLAQLLSNILVECLVQTGFSDSLFSSLNHVLIENSGLRCKQIVTNADRTPSFDARKQPAR